MQIKYATQHKRRTHQQMVTVLPPGSPHHNLHLLIDREIDEKLINGDRN